MLSGNEKEAPQHFSDGHISYGQVSGSPNWPLLAKRIESIALADAKSLAVLF